MNDLLTAAEAAEVDAYMNSPEQLAWTRKALLKWDQKRGLPSPMEKYKAELKRRLTVRRNAASAKRHAAKMSRTPQWTDDKAVKAIYAEARRLTEATGMEHHVDHFYPLQGKLVSGLHVENNLQILRGPENCRKNNHFEVEV